MLNYVLSVQPQITVATCRTAAISHLQRGRIDNSDKQDTVFGHIRHHHITQKAGVNVACNNSCLKRESIK